MDKRDDDRHYLDRVALEAAECVDEGKAGECVRHAGRFGITGSGKSCVGDSSKKHLEAVQATSVPIRRSFDALSQDSECVEPAKGGTVDRVEAAEDDDELRERFQWIRVHERSRQQRESPVSARWSNVHSTSASRVPKRSYTVTRVTLASLATASMEKGLPLTRTARAASRILVRVESTSSWR